MRNQLKTIALLGGLSAVLVGLGSMLGPSWMYGSLVLALVMNLGSYFFSDRIVLAMHRAREVGVDEAQGLHTIVGDLAARAGIPKPRVFIIHEAQPNAFATGRNPAHGVVAVTDGILGMLNERELRGVLAHELGHIKNRDILVATVAAAIAAAVTYIAHALQWLPFFQSRDDEEGDSVWGGLLLAIVAPIAATLIQLGISRSREFLADEEGARISGDPEALASALKKLEQGARHIPASHAEPATASLFIVNPLTGGRTLLNLFSTHPSTEERIRRLHAMGEHPSRGIGRAA